MTIEDTAKSSRRMNPAPMDSACDQLAMQHWRRISPQIKGKPKGQKQPNNSRDVAWDTDRTREKSSISQP